MEQPPCSWVTVASQLRSCRYLPAVTCELGSANAGGNLPWGCGAPTTTSAASYATAFYHLPHIITPHNPRRSVRCWCCDNWLNSVDDWTVGIWKRNFLYLRWNGFFFSISKHVPSALMEANNWVGFLRVAGEWILSIGEPSLLVSAHRCCNWSNISIVVNFRPNYTIEEVPLMFSLN